MKRFGGGERRAHLSPFPLTLTTSSFSPFISLHAGFQPSRKQLDLGATGNLILLFDSHHAQTQPVLPFLTFVHHAVPSLSPLSSSRPTLIPFSSNRHHLATLDHELQLESRSSRHASNLALSLSRSLLLLRPRRRQEETKAQAG